MCPAGSNCLQEVKDHPFFAGVDWTDVRAAPAPQFVPCPSAACHACDDDDALDWELTSLVRGAAEAAAAAAAAAHFLEALRIGLCATFGSV